MLTKKDIKLLTFYSYENEWLLYTTEYCYIDTHYSRSDGIKIEILGPLKKEEERTNKKFSPDKLILNDFVLNRLTEFKGFK